MTKTGKTVITVLSVILATLVALAITGFAFFTSADSESSGSDRKVGLGPSTAEVREGALS
ncbi:hypothetical protein GCM10017771_56500 [Streptomyces capitiformicae]|uniref:Uncharacterized protein n=1 Tax=Streptomyces capitiformicae TaxID=2014920 RepID=A0A919DFH5_9ACTN|nr:hypothetical protein GCM10017771_56500 [Streptomyces capitiformicae]